MINSPAAQQPSCPRHCPHRDPAPSAGPLRPRLAPLVLTALVLAAVVLPGCLAARFIPVKGPPLTTPQGVEVVRFAGGPITPSREADANPDSTLVAPPAAVASGAPRVMLEGRMYPVESINPDLLDRALRNRARLTKGPDRAVVLFCHGVFDNNASPMARLYRAAGYRVFQFDYRGFGASDRNNASTIQGIIEDASAALDYLRSRPDVDPSRIVVAGHSMGGAMALAVAARAERQGRPVSAVVAMAPFSNWRIAVSNNLGPVLAPLGFLVGGVDALNPTAHAAQLRRTPLLLVHARNDSIIPAWHSDQLAKSNWAVGGRAQILLLPGGEHVGAFLDFPSYQAPIAAFIEHTLRDDTAPDPEGTEQTDAKLREATGR